nr:MAG TPA: hypothetical protein [Caudoviricetes sp.]
MHLSSVTKSVRKLFRDLAYGVTPCARRRNGGS